MSEFKVRVQDLYGIMDSTQQLENVIQEAASDVQAVKRNLRLQVRQRERIDSRLNAAARQLERHRQSMDRTVGTGRDVAGLYEKTEQGVLRMDMNADDTGISYKRISGEELLKASNEEKDRTISQFEQENPELARIFNEFLTGGKNNKLSEDDIRDIKYLAYSANEPFRSIFLKSLPKYSIGNGDLNGGAYYSPGERTVNYSYTDFWDYLLLRSSGGGAFSDDPRSAFTTFFHECGHAIDDVSDLSNGGGSDTENFNVYSEEMGRSVTLRETIMYDVYYNKDNPHSVTHIAETIKSEGLPGTGSNGNIDKVIEAFQSGSTSDLSNEDLTLYRTVQNRHMKSIAQGAKCESVSDVYGGVSQNQLRNGYGHDNDYWNDITKAPKELWAEYFSYNMSGSEENMAYLLEYFPESAKVMEQYAYYLGQK